MKPLVHRLLMTEINETSRKPRVVGLLFVKSRENKPIIAGGALREVEFT